MGRCGVVVILLSLAGCTTEDVQLIDMSPIGVGWTYECTLSIDCDGQHMDEETKQCGPASLTEPSASLLDECLHVTGREMGCRQWQCDVTCIGVGYCIE
jgi:hypothetical protein